MFVLTVNFTYMLKIVAVAYIYLSKLVAEKIEDFQWLVELL